MVHVRLVLTRILLVKPHLHQTRQTAELDILSQRIVRVHELMEKHELLVAQCLNIDLLVAPSYYRAQIAAQHLRI